MWKLILICVFLVGCKSQAELDHDRCVRTAKRERDSCRRGVFKTTKRIEICQKIYEEDIKTCEK